MGQTAFRHEIAPGFVANPLDMSFNSASEKEEFVSDLSITEAGRDKWKRGSTLAPILDVFSHYC
jgi:hypothetical protein